MRAKMVYENVGEWEFTEETAAGTVTRNNKSITGEDGIKYHPGQVATSIVNENTKQESSFEFIKDIDSIDKRRKELKKDGYYILDSKLSKGFTAKKDDKRIVVRLDKK